MTIKELQALAEILRRAPVSAAEAIWLEDFVQRQANAAQQTEQPEAAA